MKFTQVLYAIHVGRMARFNWYWSSRRRVHEWEHEKILAAKGINVKPAHKIAYPPLPRENLSRCFSDAPLPSRKPPEVLDECQHPDYNDEPCLMYDDNHLLCQGLPQAQIITKTIVFNDLPTQMPDVSSQITDSVDKAVQRIIKSSTLFDAHQEKLPIRKDPLRPAWKYPRDYGITSYRKGMNLCKKFFNLCESLSGPEIVSIRGTLENALISFPIERERELIRLNMLMNFMVTSEKPKKPAIDVSHDENELPDISPMHFTIGLEPNHVYNLESVYPYAPSYSKKHIHTIYLFYDPTKVKNLSELEVRETQKLGRILMKAFTAAAGSARQQFGNQIKDLPEPVTVQCIETNGRVFHFSVYQLNTLDLDSKNSVKNYWWKSPRIELFTKSDYILGRPEVINYNPEVFKKILEFYQAP